MARLRAQLHATTGLDEIPKRQPVLQSLQALAKAYDTKRTAMAAVYVSGGYTLQAIVAYFGVHSGTVNRAVRRTEGQRPA